MTSVESILFRKIPRQSELFLQYLDLAPAALAFYQAPPTIQGLERRAGEIASLAQFPRQEAAALLKRQNQALGCGHRTLENIEALRLPGCVTVGTGQQVGLFTGPLYTAYKALTAIRLATELRGRNIPAVPVFWMDTEDHDLAEVTHLYASGPGATLRLLECGERLFGDIPAPHRPVGSLTFPDAVRECVAEYTSSWPAGQPGEEFRKLLETAYSPGRSFSESFGLALTGLFRDHGLILFDPMDAEAKRLVSPVFERAIADADAIGDALLKRSQELASVGYHSQVSILSNATVLFVKQGDERKAITRHGSGFGLKSAEMYWTSGQLNSLLRNEVERFSPNVLLRPIVQDHLFPTAAYVGGPSEMAYFAQVEVLYRLYHRPMPVVWPRASFTLLDPESTGLMEHYAVEFLDCLQGKDLVVERMLRSSGHSEAIAAIRDLRESLSDELEELRPNAVSLDATLGPAVDNARRKIFHNIDRLLRQSIRMETNQDHIVQQDAVRLLNTCYPNNNLQERVFGIYTFLARHGPLLIDRIHSLVRLDEFAHQVVRLE